MRKITAMLLIISLMTAAGCEIKKFEWGTKKKADPKPAPTTTTSQTWTPSSTAKSGPTAKSDTAVTSDAPAGPVKLDFEGLNLKVKIDGRNTTRLKKKDGEQLWAAPPAGPMPTIVFIMDEKALGVLNKVTISINPIVKGKVNTSDIWQPARQNFEPGKPFTLNKFTHISKQTMVQNIRKLPAGQYRLNIQVDGEKSWDRQNINLTIK
ncbi:MAG: hypothetical protein K8S55_15610 [Phycisphaerae bacterium]|nr:hypothetical protein [Phycisphaerae bacterium]